MKVYHVRTYYYDFDLSHYDSCTECVSDNLIDICKIANKALKQTNHYAKDMGGHDPYGNELEDCVTVTLWENGNWIKYKTISWDSDDEFEADMFDLEMTQED